MMAYRYSTNWMGPINYDWIQKNGEHWAAGRIDVYGGDEPYSDEIGLWTMHVEDWNRLSDWLDNFHTADQWNLDQILEEYYKTNPEIRWFDHDSI